ncbi:MAG: NHL repeat-containing protein [Candidatus Eremiobacterota bacterium]
MKKPARAARILILAALSLVSLSLGLAAQDDPPAEAPSPEPSVSATPTSSPSPVPAPARSKIYVSDSENGRILIMDDLNGANLRELGSPGRGRGRFLDPAQIWVDKQRFVYVADRGNDRVVRLEMDQLPVWTEIDGLSEPEGVAVWGEELFVSDTGNDQVLVYNDIANPDLGKPPVRTLKDPRISLPGKLWFDERGSLYVAAGEDPPGGTIVVIPDPGNPSTDPSKWEIYDGKGLRPTGYQPAQALLRNGRLLSIDVSSNRLTACDHMTGQRARELGGYGSGLGRFMRPEGLAVDDQGRIYIADTGNDRIVRIDDPTGAGWTEFEPGRDPNALLRGPKSLFVWAPSKPAPPEPPKDDKKDEKKEE